MDRLFKGLGILAILGLSLIIVKFVGLLLSVCFVGAFGYFVYVSAKAIKKLQEKAGE